MIAFDRIAGAELRRAPYRWVPIDGLFTSDDARALVTTYPQDHFKPVKGYDGEKGYQYEARSLLHMGVGEASFSERLSPAWRRLAADLASPAYRAAVTRLTGIDVGALPMEANVYHYGAKAWLGPHLDLPEKRVTHVLYFNDVWPVEDGGCIAILNSKDIADAVAVLPPIVGTSVLLVRSTSSWHAVTPVREGRRTSRRCVVVTFYAPGSVSTMWPPGDETPLRDHVEGRSRLARWVKRKIGALRR